MQQRYPVFIKASHGGFVARVPELSLMVPSATHDHEKFIVLVKDTVFTVIKALTEDGCDIPPPSNWFCYLDKVPRTNFTICSSPKRTWKSATGRIYPLQKGSLTASGSRSSVKSRTESITGIFIPKRIRRNQFKQKSQRKRLTDIIKTLISALRSKSLS